MFLNHLDDECYSPAVLKCEAAIEAATTVGTTNLVPTIAGTINQLAPSPSRSSNIPNATRPRHDDQIRNFMDYFMDEVAPFKEYCKLIDGSGETPFIRYFFGGVWVGGRSPFQRGGGRGRKRGGG